MRKLANEYTTPDLVRTIRKMLWVIHLLDGQAGQGALLDEALEELGLLFREYQGQLQESEIAGTIIRH